MKGSSNIYTLSEFKDLNRTVNTALDSTYRGDSFIDQTLFTQPRNLDREDMAEGTLFGDIKYVVAHKTDGKHRVLIFHKGNTWLVFPPNIYDLIGRSNPGSLVPGLTIVEGEYIPKGDRTSYSSVTSTYWFEVIDLLYLNGKNTRDDSYLNRLARSRSLVEGGSEGGSEGSSEGTQGGYRVPDLYISYKEEHEYNTKKELEVLVKRLLNDQAFLPYNTDGLIFTPRHVPYIKALDLSSARRERGDQNKVRPLNVLKWKPQDKLTIDFRIGKGGQLLYASDRGDEVPFQGTHSFPFYPEMIDEGYNRDLLGQEGLIVEFAYSEGKFRAVRPREEKTAPNSATAVFSIWNLLRRPIDLTDLSVSDIKLMKDYHRMISSNLFSYPLRQFPVGASKFLLDIGAGGGGDIKRWMEYDYIIAVEPDVENLSELRKRVESSYLKEKVYAIKAGGEETSKILRVVNEITGGRGVDVISMIDSLTFFWKDLNMLQNLVATLDSCLRKGGYFIWKTLNGDSVRNEIQPAFSQTGTSTENITYGQINFRLTRTNGIIDREIRVSIPGIVGQDQVEYLTRMTDLRQLLGNFSGNSIFAADKDRNLPPDILRISRLYSYSVWRKEEDTIVKVLPSDIIEQNYLTYIRIVESQILPQNLTYVATQPVPGPAYVPEISSSTPARVPVALISEIPIERNAQLVESSTFKTCNILVRPVVTPIPGDTSFPSFDSHFRSRDDQKIKIKKESIGSLSGPPDFSAPINVDWISNHNEKGIFRIVTLGTGNDCLFHAVLNSYYPPYQENRDINYRAAYARQLRSSLASFLVEKDPNYPETPFRHYAESRYVNWETTSSYPSFYTSQVKNIADALAAGGGIQEVNEIFYNYGTDFSLVGVYNTFVSDGTLGDGHIEIIARNLGIVMIALEGVKTTEVRTNSDGTETRGETSEKFNIVSRYGELGKGNPIIIIANVTNHWELVARKGNNDFLQTIFSEEDPMIRSMIDIGTAIGEEPSNPLANFLEGIKNISTREKDEEGRSYLRLREDCYRVMNRSLIQTNHQGYVSYNIDRNPFYARLWAVEDFLSKESFIRNPGSEIFSYGYVANLPSENFMNETEKYIDMYCRDKNGSILADPTNKVIEVNANLIAALKAGPGAMVMGEGQITYFQYLQNKVRTALLEKAAELYRLSQQG